MSVLGNCVPPICVLAELQSSQSDRRVRLDVDVVVQKRIGTLFARDDVVPLDW